MKQNDFFFCLTTTLVAAFALSFGEPVLRAASSNQDSQSSLPEEQIAEDAEWKDLVATAEATRTKQAWRLVRDQARAYSRKFVGSAHAKSAARIAIIASIHIEEDELQLSPETTQEAVDYIRDVANSARDRLDVAIVLGQTKLKQRGRESREQRLAAHEAHARELVQEFPDQPEGYGYLVAVAKAAPPEKALTLVAELQSMPISSALKAQAQRIAGRIRLLGKPFAFAAARDSVVAARGRVLIVYTWKEDDAGVIETVVSLSKKGDFRFIGVNLDPDRSRAEAAAVHLRLPGVQLYEPAGREGLIGEELQLTMDASLYLIGPDGTLLDVDGHRNANATLQGLVERRQS